MFDLRKFKVPRGFRGRSALVVQLWWIFQSTLFSWSPQFLYSWRRCLLRIFGAEIGRNVIIRPTVKITYPWKVSIGDGSWIGDDVVLYSLGEIKIGRNTVISQKSYLCTGSHDFSKVSFDIFSKPISVGDSTWLASDVFVGPGVSIGRCAVVGARSTVFQDVPDDCVFRGNPASLVKERPPIVN